MNNSRRSFLRRSGLLAGSALLASPTLASQTATYSLRNANPNTPVATPFNGLDHLVFHNLNTGETRECPLCVDGNDSAEVRKAFNYIFRDWRTNEQAQMDLGLLEQLSQIQQRLGTNKPITLISGYRSPKTNNMLRQRSKGVAKKSFHMVGKAMDFNIPGVSLASIRKAALDLKAGGVGYYPGSGFVHIDTGPVRRWG